MAETSEALEAAKKALEYSINCLDGVVSHDDEDMGEDGGSAACQAAIKIAKRSITKIDAALLPRPVEAGEKDWCQPKDCGKIKPRQFIVYFEDADRGIATFTDETEARAFYKRASIGYNCYLFGALPTSPDTGDEGC